MSVVALMITGWDAGPWERRLQSIDSGLDIRTWPDIGNAADIDYALVWKPDGKALASLANLKVIFSLGAGVDHILGADNIPDIPIVRIVDPNLTARMSEYVVLHCLARLRRYAVYREQQARKEWIEQPDPCAAEVRVGVMGYGVLGQDAARKLAVMGFDVAAWNRSEKNDGDIPVFSGEAGKAEFLARTDILVSLLPLTPDTHGVLNTALFEGLARDGVLGPPSLINAGRGKLQNEPDILDALDRGVLSEAVLDVFVEEPLPAESPFWTHPKVVLTPHNAAISDPRALVEYVYRQIARYETGEPLENVVDRTRGY
ncbi:MAG: glyoxylate/hydroxypyruvate reductase A [Pseudomonadota bacterium]